MSSTASMSSANRAPAKEALVPVTLDELLAAVGGEYGVSDWRTITQQMIDRFADVTDDHQYIHVDPVRAAETPFGGTIAHGFLTLSLLSAMAYESLRPLVGSSMTINYGFEKLRFVTPVRSGARVRARFDLVKVAKRPFGWVEVDYDVAVEVEGAVKPAIALRWLTRVKMEQDQ